MPYDWIKTAETAEPELHLWPHQSLPPKGFAAFITATFTLILIPILPLLGSPVLWGVLPFLLLAVWAMYFALQRNHQARQISEVLTVSNDEAHLMRRNPKGDVQEWRCNRYWARPEMHTDNGPVPHYVTLVGEGREVEIGAFLSEEERLALYDDLVRLFSRH